MIIFITFFSLLLFITVTPNAIHALLALICLFINFALLLFLLDSTFLGFSYILVYIWAICVLFLYIILLLHLRIYSLMQKFNTFFLLGLIVIFIFGLSYTNFSFETITNSINSFEILYLTDLQLFTNYLFVTHQHYMLMGIFLLLIALFLSIFLSTRFLIVIKNKNFDITTNA